ncbi:arginyltransferase [Sessilibacter sp. MAH2]
MTNLANLKLFTTHPHKCSYLQDEIATTVFVDPDAEINREIYSRLSEIGFRRSGQHLYRPQCAFCSACIPVRIPVKEFTPNRQQKRCLKLNSDITFKVVNSIDAKKHYQLYEKYINERHADGDMYPPSRAQYSTFLTSEWGLTRFIEFYLESTLIAVAVIDELETGISAVYTFFDPELQSRSLGTFAILTQIQLAEELGLHAVYLGYWIKNCTKMTYKSKFKPLESYIDGRWIRDY